MKVEFKDSFFESIEKLAWYDTKLWKVWEFIRRGIPTFFGNIWRFRKELYSHQWWDYRYTLEMLHRSLTIMVDKLENDGIEEDVSRGKKVAKIKRAIQLLDNRLNDNYIEQAEAEFGKLHLKPLESEDLGNGTSRLLDTNTKEENEHNRRVFKLASTIDDREWRELWNIFKGQSILDYKKLLKTIPTEEQKTRDVWNEWYNGSDMRGWWD
jgi:hypothetical protein